MVHLGSTLLGYFFGIARSFREEEQRGYREILPAILKVAYHPEKKEEEDFLKTLSELWCLKKVRVAENSSLSQPPRRAEGLIFRS
ncbi:MAG: hypothetical protein A2170_00855 [Deltaproteobacteria bacterium RBG_13_53_10]|nr:MAG: hypothetical protein A2170_00855 [Deltaproteobacteria bacterium RBG_13_53_10]